MSFKNMKIGQRLALSFGAMIALLLVMSAMTYIRISGLNSNISVTLKDRYPKTVLVHEIRDQLNETVRRALNLLVMVEAHQINSEIDGIAKNSEAISAALKQLDQTVTSTEGRDSLKAVIEARQKFDVLQARFIQLVKEDKKEDARLILLTELRPVQMDYFSALQTLLDYQANLMTKAGEVSEAAASQTEMLVLALAILATLGGILISVLATRSITRPLQQAVAIADRVSHGDLSSQIAVDRADETGQLLQALKDMNDSLVKIVGQVRMGTDAISSASSQIAAGNMDLSSRTEQQASSLEETASSMEELTSTVKQNADNARQANSLAMSASEVAVKGGTVVSQVVDTMGSINDSSKKIVDIIGVIDGIAFQTNILALNAAVEAARAGEQGRGFAVVASEVRSLAQRSAAAAKEIKGLIGDSVEKVEAGAKLVDQAGETMHEIVESIRRVTDIMGEITAASTEQTAGIEQINMAIGQMDDATQQNAALVEEAAAAAQSMQNQAGQLSHAVGVFKLGQQSARGLPAPAKSKAASTALAAPKPRKPATDSNAVARKEPTAPSKQMVVSKAGGNSDDWEEF